MLSRLERLLDLQQIDAELRKLEAELKTLPGQIERHRKEIARRAAETAQLEARRKETAVKRQTLETELKARESQAAKFRQQQLMVRTPKELEAITHEIERCEAEISRLEDEILTLIESEDKLAADLVRYRAEQTAHDEQSAAHICLLESLMTEKGQLANALRMDRIAALEHLDEPLRLTYEWLLKTHGPSAVVKLDGEACSGCGALLPPSEALRISAGDDLHQCPRCNRFLYRAKNL
jgi:predicted  nucleic acid-binding Zn-ribbon protein